jgi:Domain of unknown function (DUF4440)
MQFRFIYACVLLTSLAWAQQPASPPKPSQNPQPAGASTELNLADSKLKDLFESKIKTEWDALKNKDKKAYGALLADDYEGVEVDNQGERTKIQAMNEVADGNVYDYTIWGYKLIPLGPDAAFVIYEVTLQFPPKSVVRYSRVYITELWVKRGGEWKELHYQETHVR